MFNSFLGVFPSDIQPDVTGMKTFSLIFTESKHNEVDLEQRRKEQSKLAPKRDDFMQQTLQLG